MERDILVQLLGIVLASAIPIVVLILTLRSNRKAQTKNSNMQNSLLAKESIGKEIDRAKQTITEAYNQLEELLFITSTLKPRSKDIQQYIDKVNKIYVLFRQSINTLRFNTEIYRRRKWCEGCTLCEIKIYGDLAKATSILQEIIVDIDREVSNAFSFLTVALESAADSHDLISKQNTLMELDRNYKSMIGNLEDLLRRVFDENEAQRLDNEIASALASKLENEKEIKGAEGQLDILMKNIGDNNTQARTKINDVLMKNKPQLDNAIVEYFDIYKEYSRQVSTYISEKGSIDGKCKKIYDDKSKK